MKKVEEALDGMTMTIVYLGIPKQEMP